MLVEDHILRILSSFLKILTLLNDEGVVISKLTISVKKGACHRGRILKSN